MAGSDTDIQKLIHAVEERRAKTFENEDEAECHVSLSQYVIETDSDMVGKSIANLGIREKTECIIVAIDRDEESIVNISPNFTFVEGDTLLLAGEKDKLNSFEKNVDAK